MLLPGQRKRRERKRGTQNKRARDVWEQERSELKRGRDEQRKRPATQGSAARRQHSKRATRHDSKRATLHHRADSTRATLAREQQGQREKKRGEQQSTGEESKKAQPRAQTRQTRAKTCRACLKRAKTCRACLESAMPCRRRRACLKPHTDVLSLQRVDSGYLPQDELFEERLKTSNRAVED